MLIFLVPILAAVFLAAGYLMFAYRGAGDLLNPTRKPVVRTPKEYGLDYEDIEFRSTDGINLNGWLIPGKSNFQHERVIILPHAMNFNRHGWWPTRRIESLYHQPDVDFLPIAKALNHSGYSILMFDLGNHGESDGRKMCGVGLNEYQDIAGAVEYVGHRYREDSPRIGIIAFCLGANSTIIAMSKARERMRDVVFLVLIQPVTPRVFLRGFTKSVYTRLALLLIPVTERLYRWRGGYDLDEMSPQNYAGDINVPTLHVQAKEDNWTTLSDVRSIYDRIGGPKELWLIEGKMKRFDTYVYLGKQPDRIIDFASRHFSHDVTQRHIAAR